MNILLAINDGYLEQTIVLLQSIFANNEPKDISLFFLCRNLSVSSRKKIKKFAVKSGASIIYVTITDDLFKNAPKRKNISIETYFRLLAFEFLPKVDKILYLDADIIVTGSLKELYETNMQGKCIAGVADQGTVQTDRYHKAKLGLHRDTVYINGGVLLMNLVRMREIVSSKQIYDFIDRMGKKLVYQDQDVINVLFEKEIINLSMTYNQSPLYFNLDDFYRYIKAAMTNRLELPIVIHYMGETTKPWKDNMYGYKYIKVYYHYCCMANSRELQKKVVRNLLLRPLALWCQYLNECRINARRMRK